MLLMSMQLTASLCLYSVGLQHNMLVHVHAWYVQRCCMRAGSPWQPWSGKNCCRLPGFISDPARSAWWHGCWTPVCNAQVVQAARLAQSHRLTDPPAAEIVAAAVSSGALSSGQLRLM